MNGISSGPIVTILIGIGFLWLIYILKLKTNKLKEKEVHEKSGTEYMIEKDEMVLEKEDDEKEIVAAIMAAICAYSGMKQSNLNIKSIRRINNNDSAWRNAELERMQ